MKITKISYAHWDGDPALLAYRDDGSILGFVFRNGKWNEPHAADIATKGGTLGEERFKAMFPDLALPPEADLVS